MDYGTLFYFNVNLLSIIDDFRRLEAGLNFFFPELTQIWLPEKKKVKFLIARLFRYSLIIVLI